MTILQRRRRHRGGKRKPAWKVSRWDVRQAWLKAFGPTHAERLFQESYPGHRRPPATTTPFHRAAEPEKE